MRQLFKIKYTIRQRKELIHETCQCFDHQTPFFFSVNTHLRERPQAVVNVNHWQHRVRLEVAVKLAVVDGVMEDLDCVIY